MLWWSYIPPLLRSPRASWGPEFLSFHHRSECILLPTPRDIGSLLSGGLCHNMYYFNFFFFSVWKYFRPRAFDCLLSSVGCVSQAAWMNSTHSHQLPLFMTNTLISWLADSFICGMRDCVVSRQHLRKSCLCKGPWWSSVGRRFSYRIKSVLAFSIKQRLIKKNNFITQVIMFMSLHLVSRNSNLL